MSTSCRSNILQFTLQLHQYLLTSIELWNQKKSRRKSLFRENPVKTLPLRAKKILTSRECYSRSSRDLRLWSRGMLRKLNRERHITLNLEYLLLSFNLWIIVWTQVLQRRIQLEEESFPDQDILQLHERAFRVRWTSSEWKESCSSFHWVRWSCISRQIWPSKSTSIPSSSLSSSISCPNLLKRKFRTWMHSWHLQPELNNSQL